MKSFLKPVPVLLAFWVGLIIYGMLFGHPAKAADITKEDIQQCVELSHIVNAMVIAKEGGKTLSEATEPYLGTDLLPYAEALGDKVYRSDTEGLKPYEVYQDFFKHCINEFTELRASQFNL